MPKMADIKADLKVYKGGKWQNSVKLYNTLLQNKQKTNTLNQLTEVTLIQSSDVIYLIKSMLVKQTFEYKKKKKKYTSNWDSGCWSGNSAWST